MKKYFLAVVCIAAIQPGLNAQVLITDGYNAGSTAYDFSNAEIVATAPGGVGYVANNGGIHYHHGPVSATLTVNGVYNAYDASVAGFTGTTANPGIDYFQGLNGAQATGQEIAGNTAPRFGILKLDNGSNAFNIVNSNGVEIGLRTDFTNGITTTLRANSSTGAIKFLTGSSYTNSAPGDAQYVNGYVSKTGSSAFTFPVGNQAGTDMRTLAISGQAIGTTLSVSYWSGDVNGALDPTGGAHSRASLAPGLVSVSPIGFWDWIPLAGSGAVNIAASLPAQTGAGSYTVAADIRLVGWNNTTSRWEVLGIAGASGLTEGSTLSGTTSNLSLYSAIGWGSISQAPVPLPIVLQSFAGYALQCTAFLSWYSANEASLERYEVENSQNGSDFDVLAVMDARHNEPGKQYTYSTRAIPQGRNYFRLKLVDLNGIATYSNAIFVNNSCNEHQIVISPNPFVDKLSISGLADEYHVKILTAIGQQILSLQHPADKVVVDLSRYAPGAYMVEISEGGKRVMSQWVIKR